MLPICGHPLQPARAAGSQADVPVSYPLLAAVGAFDDGSVRVLVDGRDVHAEAHLAGGGCQLT
jgi:hypothetical protein